MKLKLIFVLFLMVLVALFSVQNADMTTIRFLHWHFTLSLALVILLSAFSGCLVGLIIGAISARGTRGKRGDIEAPLPGRQDGSVRNG